MADLFVSFIFLILAIFNILLTYKMHYARRLIGTYKALNILEKLRSLIGKQIQYEELYQPISDAMHMQSVYRDGKV